MTPQEIGAATLEHALLVLVAMLAAVSVALPLGVWAHRNRRAGKWILRVVDTLQTVPSLALFGLLLPLPLVGGIGPRLALLVLFGYALLPLLRGVVAGLEGVPAEVREAALALGMKPQEMLREVELPLAAPAIAAGVRVATVASIGTATVAAAVGAGGLGVFLYRGLASVDERLLLAGALPAAGLAILADWILSRIEERLRRRR